MDEPAHALEFGERAQATNRARYIAPVLALCSITAVIITLMAIMINAVGFSILPPRLGRHEGLAVIVDFFAIIPAIFAAVFFVAASMSANLVRNTAGYAAFLLWIAAMIVALFI